MSTYLLFFLLGLGAGSVYANLGLGLVLKYRSAGVVDFGHAARDLLTAGGLDVHYTESDAAHHVDPRSLAELPAWVEQALS